MEKKSCIKLEKLHIERKIYIYCTQTHDIFQPYWFCDGFRFIKPQWSWNRLIYVFRCENFPFFGLFFFIFFFLYAIRLWTKRKKNNSTNTECVCRWTFSWPKLESSPYKSWMKLNKQCKKKHFSHVLIVFHWPEICWAKCFCGSFTVNK